jgi:regulatory protein
MYKRGRSAQPYKSAQQYDPAQQSELPDQQQPAQQFPVVGAVLTGIESHPKQPHMYRIIVRVETDECYDPDNHNDLNNSDGDDESRKVDWTDEVDALIASAASVRGDSEVVLTVHEDTLVGWRLLKGRKLTAEEYETLRQEEQKEDAYRRALGMLERKARTRAEMANALKRKRYAPEVVEGCLERLQARRMLDDSAYAKRFTETRATSQRKGRMLIRQELLQRGVGRELIEQAINELDSDVEQQSALTLARKKWPSTKGNERERKQKLMGMLLRRGFPSSVVRSAVQQAASEHADDKSDDEFGDEDSFGSEYMED